MENPANSDRKATAVEILTRARESAVRLGILIQKKWPGNSSAAEGLFEEVMSSLSRAIDELESDDESIKADKACIDEAKDETSGKKRKNSGVGRGGYRKRKQASQLNTVISKTNYDEYSWRKYGQKDIHSSKFPRSYFRCTHKFDQGCQATKQVQKSEEDPSLLVITYIGEHSCKNKNHVIMSSASSEPSIISFGSNSNYSNLTQDISPMFARRPENEEEVLSNPRPGTPSSDFFGLPNLYEGPLMEQLMNVPAAQRGGDEIGCIFDSLNFEEDVFGYGDGGFF